MLVDDQPAGTDVRRPARCWRRRRGGLDALGRCDVVVKAPGISRYRPDVAELEAAGIPVVGGLGLWMEEVDRDRVVCVTGTKGKSTTTAVAGHLLDRLGYRCLVGGNIGRPPWDPDVGDDYDFWVVETSSFQATDLASSPPVVAVTSLAPDHLDWHGDVETLLPGQAVGLSPAGSPAHDRRRREPPAGRAPRPSSVRTSAGSTSAIGSSTARGSTACGCWATTTAAMR